MNNIPEQELVSKDQIDPHSSVIVDGQTLLSLEGLYNELHTKNGIQVLRPGITSGGFCVHPVVAKFVEDFILHDSVVIDSQLVWINDFCFAVYNDLRACIKLIKLNQDERKEIADAVFKEKLSDDRKLIEQIPQALEHSHIAMHIGRADHEKIFYDSLYEVDDQLNDLNDYGLSESGIEYGIYDMPLFLRNSNMSFARTHYYLELQRYLGIPLSPHPDRSAYFKTIIEKDYYDDLPRTIISDIESKIRSSLCAYSIFNLKTTLPSVFNHVINLAHQRELSVVHAMFEYREDRYAKSFREYCRKISQQINGEAVNLADLSKLKLELDDFCNNWISCTYKGGIYQNRTINFSRIPVIGLLLQMFGLDKFNVSDPVLFGKKDYFLFLSELFEQPLAYTNARIKRE